MEDHLLLPPEREQGEAWYESLIDSALFGQMGRDEGFIFVLNNLHRVHRTYGKQSQTAKELHDAKYFPLIIDSTLIYPT